MKLDNFLLSCTEFAQFLEFFSKSYFVNVIISVISDIKEKNTKLTQFEVQRKNSLYKSSTLYKKVSLVKETNRSQEDYTSECEIKLHNKFQ